MNIHAFMIDIRYSNNKCVGFNIDKLDYFLCGLFVINFFYSIIEHIMYLVGWCLNKLNSIAIVTAKTMEVALL